MGWGLRAGAEIGKGALVIEYVGEVIDENMMQVCCVCICNYVLMYTNIDIHSHIFICTCLSC